jgi:hypothetical protein
MERLRHHRHKRRRIIHRQDQLAGPRRLAPGEKMLRGDIVPACHLRQHGTGRIRFRDDPFLGLLTPAASPPNTSLPGDLSDTPRRTFETLAINPGYPIGSQRQTSDRRT